MPLQLDTTSLEAPERGPHLYHGEAMVNSVNGREESLETVFPLAAKYGSMVVGLAFDEGNIPEDVEGHIRVAKKIYTRAAAYGIPPEGIIIDGLAMTISTDDNSASVTLEVLRCVRDELHGRSIFGVGNISFGLPQRELINSSFFALAMKSGLSCVIIDSNNEVMMAAHRSCLILSGLDRRRQGYIAEYAGRINMFAGEGKIVATVEGDEKAKIGDAEPPEGMQGSPLIGAVRFGLGKEVAEETKRHITKGEAPFGIVNWELIPALDVVDRGFEEGTLFLPQLLMLAEATKAAFEVIRNAMSGTARRERGSVILVTVEGDIRDISENIVKILTENCGYEVYDLGYDVPAGTIVEAVVVHDVKLIGLSALMTTTVANMEDAVKLVREGGSGVKVVVDGAVMTKEYADDIGAGRYAKEAIDTVRYADMLSPEAQRKSEAEIGERPNVFRLSR